MGHCQEYFLEQVARHDAPDVLEIGTLRWDQRKATHHRKWFSKEAHHVKTDVEAGMDVDVVADAHDLEPFGTCTFDAVLAMSVWEHLRRPWLAAAAVHRVLKPGGVALVGTHQTFPIHGYPNDYYRYTREGLEEIFRAGGFYSVESEYAYPATITPPREVTNWNKKAPAWLNVVVVAMKEIP